MPALTALRLRSIISYNMSKGLGTQIVAGILGLLFIVGLVLLGKRLGQDLRVRFFGDTRTKQLQITPTPADIAFITPTPRAEISTTRVYTVGKGGVREIPKTGAETLLISSLLLPAGLYLRRKI